MVDRPLDPHNQICLLSVHFNIWAYALKLAFIHLRQCENMYALCVYTRTREHMCECVCATMYICRLYRITLIFVVKNLAD